MEIVKYKNQLNDIRLTKFTEIELNIFITICARLRDKENQEIIISELDLRKITKYSKKDTQYFDNTMNDLKAKLKIINWIPIIDEEWEREICIFEEFARNTKTKQWAFKVNDKARYILNSVTSEFTIFELEEFLEIQGKYNKNLYRLLKQWRTQGKTKYYTIEELKEKLDIPNHYTNKRIMQIIINPSVIALSKYFDNLECEVDKKGRGGAIQGLTFSFKKELKALENQEQAKQSFKATRTREKKNKFNDMELQSETYSNITIDEYEQAILSN